MIKVNKRLILMIIFVLTMSILVGCSNAELPEGIENKEFLKNLDKIYELSLKSMSEKKYYKNEINEILKNMNQEKLNDYESTLLDKLEDILVKVESDLTTGDKTIQSSTFDEMQIFGEILDN